MRLSPDTASPGRISGLIKGKFRFQVCCITTDPQGLLTTPDSSRDSSWKFLSMLTGIQARETVSPKNVTWYLDWNKRWLCYGLLFFSLLWPSSQKRRGRTEESQGKGCWAFSAPLYWPTYFHCSSILTSVILINAYLSKHTCPNKYLIRYKFVSICENLFVFHSS